MKRLIFISLLITNWTFAKLNVVVSIQPELEFVNKIGGDKVETTLMVLAGKSPHTYEPKPSQMKAISHANLYLSIGVEFEKVWLNRFKDQNPNLKISDISKGINKTAMVESVHHHEHEEGLDPHIWTDPINVKTIARNIYSALSQADINNSNYYKKNLDKYLVELDQLDKNITNILKDIPKGSSVMVFHPALGYFLRRYHLKQLPIEIEGKAPKPRVLIQIIKKAKKQKVKAIFTQPEFSDKSAQIIAKELNIRVIKTSPLARDWEENLIKLARDIAGKNE
ncbi:MAG TPA: zinc ABC transporter substrate-binding protein [Campylobacterales bacterium]|nr:zinc ABC transporter substrate-binding protein [Campylobacterales bacterium]